MVYGSIVMYLGKAIQLDRGEWYSEFKCKGNWLWDLQYVTLYKSSVMDVAYVSTTPQSINQAKRPKNL